MDQYSVVIDGRSVVAPVGASILEAARLAGVGIPALCYHPALPIDGSCRLCLVEIAGRRGLLPSCALPVADGLHVATETPAVVEARRNTLRLLLSRYRRGAGRSDNELLALADRYGIAPPPSDGRRWPVDESNPFIRVDRDACIHCWRCVQACSHLNGVTAIGVFGRAQDAHIGFGVDGRMQDSTCEFCGMCEAVCPTDALVAREAFPTSRPEDSRVSNTVCGYCGVGCRLDLHVAGGRIVGTRPDWEAAANRGLLCVKGRFGWPYVHHHARLTRPRVRRSLLEGRGQEWVETDWPTALDLVARRLTDLARRHGPMRSASWLQPNAPTRRTTWCRSSLAKSSAPTTSITARGCATRPPWWR
jgi:predicted molibdopterin-dependent oxidoreductase YjgC